MQITVNIKLINIVIDITFLSSKVNIASLNLFLSTKMPQVFC